MFAESSTCDFHLRPAMPEDAEGIAKVHVQTWKSHYRGLVPDSFLDRLSVREKLEHWRYWLDRARRDELGVFTALAGDGPVGFVKGGPTRGSCDDVGFDAELYAIYIIPAFQGLGIGRRLFESFRGWCIEHGYDSFLCWVLADNHSSRRFYEHLDGRLLDRRKTLCFDLHELPLAAYGWADLRSR